MGHPEQRRRPKFNITSSGVWSSSHLKLSTNSGEISWRYSLEIGEVKVLFSVSKNIRWYIPGDIKYPSHINWVNRV